jgi:hypothetical protein
MKTYVKISLLVMAAFLVVVFNSCKKDKGAASKVASGLYFTYYNGKSVNKIDLVNTPNSITPLFNSSDGLSGPETITLTDDGYLIVTDENNNQILKMQKNGVGTITVLYDNSDGVDEPDGITVDNATNTIYWTNSNTGQVMKGSTDGLTAPEALYGGDVVLNYAYGIAIDKSHKKLYISDFSEGIKVGNLDGTGTMTVLWDNSNYTDMGYPSNIYVDGSHGKIYWGDETADAVVEANLDGTGTPTVLFDASDGVDRADGVYVDYASKQIYWSETNSSSGTPLIARGNLDGTGAREVLVDNVESYGIILEFE